MNDRSAHAAPRWLTRLEHELGVSVASYRVSSGGDFADSFQVSLHNGERLFVKTHHHDIERFFLTEAAGLGWLRDTQTVAVPQVLALADDPPLLALQWIEPGFADAQSELALGRDLAALHRHSSARFGRPDQRSTGSQGVPNRPCKNWHEFYATQRLLPLAAMAREKKALPDKQIRQLESIAGRLDELGGPAEPAALLHGDLWAGNRLVDQQGRSWLIDAAAHYGHREFDLAMMRLFGGFSDACFAAYAEAWPLAEGHEDRILLHQLAPLVVHAIKFGSHYVNASARALQTYS